MKNLVYEDYKIIKGPWILDIDSLHELSNIIANVSNYFQNRENTKISIQLYFKSNKIHEYSSLEDILKNDDLKDQVVKDFKLKIRNSLESIYIDIYDKNRLSYNVDIKDQEEKKRLIQSINNWIERIKPSSSLKIWSTKKLEYWSLGAVLYLTFKKTRLDYYKEELNDKMNTLLSQGISEENIYDAVQILLEKNYNYIPSTFEKVAPINGTYYLLLYFLIGIIFIFSPINYFAIGKGKKSIKFIQNYIKAITYTIPAYIFLDVIFPFIKKTFL